MKRSPPALLCLAAFAAILVASCATTAPAPAPKAPPAPEKVRKERTVLFKTPVLVKESSYYSDGLLDEYVVYKYDDALRRLLEKGRYDSARSEPLERTVSEWKDGRALSETVYETEGRVKLRKEFAYDAEGNVASEKVLDAKSIPQSSSSYAYDKAGNKVEWRAFDGKGALKAITKYVYEKGALALIDLQDGAGKSAGAIKHEYGPDGKLAKRSYLGADGALQKYEAYAYERGLLVSLETRRADGALAAKSTYTYGASGELVAATEADGGGAVKGKRTFEYSMREDSKVEVYYE